MNELEQNYLAHHGILGQKWHKRNGPPYPLDAGDHSKSEKEAGYKKSIGGGRNEELYDRKTVKKEARRVTKQLNKLDQTIAYDVHDKNQSLMKLDKYANKFDQKKAKGKSTEKLEKKINKEWDTIQEKEKSIRLGQEETQKILNSLPDTMSLNSKIILRQSQKGLDFILDQPVPLHTGIGTIGSLGTPGIEFVRGKEYKVKAKSKKELAKIKEENYKKNMDRIQEKYDLAHEKEKEYLKKHPGAKEGEDYDFVEKFYTKADEEIEKKYKR